MADAAAMRRATSSLRMGRDLSGRLEDGGFGVGAEHGLEGLDDLALGGMYAGAVKEVRHQIVLVLRRGGLELGECGLACGAVAAGADALDAVDLLALQGRVDPQDLDLAVAALGEGVDADELAGAAVVVLLELERRVGDLPLRVAALDRLHHPAQLVDL